MSTLRDIANPERFVEARDILDNLRGINPGYRDVETLIRSTYYDPIVLTLTPVYDVPDAEVCVSARESLEEFTQIDPLAMDYRDTRLMINETYYCEARANVIEADTQASTQNILTCDNQNYEDARTAIRELRLDSNYRDLNQLVIHTFYDPAVEAYRYAFFEDSATDSQRNDALNCARRLLTDLTANQQYYLLYYQDAGLLYRSTFYIPAYRAYQTALTAFEADGQTPMVAALWDAARTALEPLMSESLTFAPPLDFAIEGEISIGELLASDETEADVVVAALTELPEVGEMYFNSYFLPVMAAFDNQAWADAQRLIAVLQADSLLPNSYFSDAIFVLRSSYYIPGRAAFDNRDWAGARPPLETLVNDLRVPDFRTEITAPTALTLLKNTYAIPAADVYAELREDYNHPDWESFIETIRDLAAIDPQYAVYIPVRAEIFLREALYQRASLAETAALAAETDDRERVNAWQITLDSLLELLALDADPTLASPNLLLDVRQPYRDSQDRLRNVFHQLADSALQAGDWVSARDAAQRLLSYDPADPTANLQLREAYYSAGVEAQEQSEWADAIDEFTTLIQLDANITQTGLFATPTVHRDADQRLLAVYHNYAQALIDDGQFSRSREISGALLTNLPDDVEGNRLFREAYYQEGAAALDKGEYSAARVPLTLLLRMDASSANFLTSNTAPYKDANRLYRQTYYAPARANIEAKLWTTARSEINSLLALDPADPVANDILIETYTIPAENALNVGNWGTAQTTYRDLFENTNRAWIINAPSYYDAGGKYMNAYLIPAETAIEQEDWAIARTNAEQAIQIGVSLLLNTAEDQQLSSSLDKARQTLLRAYDQPIQTAFENQDWQSAQTIIRGLLETIEAGAEDRQSWYLSRETAEEYLLDSYVRPVNIAIEKGDIAGANRVLEALTTDFPNSLSMITRLRIRLFNLPLFDAIEHKDWESAGDLYVELTDQSVFPSLLDTTLLDLPELRAELASRYTGYWLTPLNEGLSYSAITSGTTRTVTAQALNTSGKLAYLATADGKLYLQPLTESGSADIGSPILQVDTGTFLIADMVIDPRGEWLATLHEDNLARIWNAESGQLITMLGGHDARLTALAVSDDGSRLITGDSEGGVQLWDSTDFSASLASTSVNAPVSALELSPDGGVILAATRDNQLHLLDSALVILKSAASTQNIEQIIFNPSRSAIITLGNMAQMYIWNMDLNLTAVLAGHEDWVRSAALTSDGDYLISVGDDQRVIVWNVVLGEAVNTLEGLPDAAADIGLSADDRVLLVSGQRGGLVLWDAGGQK